MLWGDFEIQEKGVTTGGQGRVRVEGVGKISDPHPARQPAGCRAALSQRERDSAPRSFSTVLT